MLFKSTLILLAIALSAASRPSGEVSNSTAASVPEINRGRNTITGDIVAWIAGESKCGAVPITPIGTKACGIPFALAGQVYEFKGCAGNPSGVDLWLEKNGVRFASCPKFTEGDECGIVTTRHCS